MASFCDKSGAPHLVSITAVCPSWQVVLAEIFTQPSSLSSDTPSPVQSQAMVLWDVFFNHVSSVLVYYIINSCHFACEKSTDSKNQKLMFHLECTAGLHCLLLSNYCEQKMFKLLFNVMQSSRRALQWILPLWIIFQHFSKCVRVILILTLW